MSKIFFRFIFISLLSIIFLATLTQFCFAFDCGTGCDSAPCRPHGNCRNENTCVSGNNCYYGLQNSGLCPYRHICVCGYDNEDPNRPVAGAGECCDVGCTDSGWSDRVQNDANCAPGEVCNVNCQCTGGFTCAGAGGNCMHPLDCFQIPPAGSHTCNPDPFECTAPDGCCCIPPLSQCDDGADNDGDGFIDFPNDPECTDANDDDEANGGPPPGACPPECPCPGGDCEGGLVPCGRTCDDPDTGVCECCPCTLCHLFVMFKKIVDFAFLNIVIPLAILMSVIGGIMLLTAAGNPGQISQGKAVIKAVIIGLVIIFASWMIVNTVVTFLTPADSPFQSWHTIDCPVP